MYSQAEVPATVVYSGQFATETRILCGGCSLLEPIVVGLPEACEELGYWIVDFAKDYAELLRQVEDEIERDEKEQAFGLMVC